MKANWTTRPTVTGWYWLRWRHKWGRQWTHECVWFSDGNPDEYLTMTWLPIALLSANASFSGPLVPPPAGEQRSRKMKRRATLSKPVRRPDETCNRK